jgi:hypothetical protein
LNVSAQDRGDWLNYNVNIPAAGIYTMSFRVAGLNTNAQLADSNG